MGKISSLRVRLALGRYGCMPVKSVSCVDSTNLRLKTGAREGTIRPPYLLIADSQTAGRGRLGRAFVSPPGSGLYMSLLAPMPEGADPGSVTVLAAVAVCRALEEMTPLHPRIKWVNDLFLGTKKVCGILAERVENGVVIGIGINIWAPPGGFPPEAGAAGALNVPVSRGKLAGRIGALLMEMLKNPRDESILDAYRRRMMLLGKTIQYTHRGQTKSARVTGVDDAGGLMVTGDEGETTLRCGEVTLGSQSLADLE